VGCTYSISLQIDRFGTHGWVVHPRAKASAGSTPAPPRSKESPADPPVPAAQHACSV